MPLTRREFLKGLSYTAGGIGLSAASYRHLIPFIHQPDEIIPGVSTWFATSCRECPAGCDMIVRNRDAHVVKCEGNPKSPINLGKLCARGQAALHGLYDPDRIKGPLRRNVSGAFVQAAWKDVLPQLGSELAKHPRIALITDLQTGSLDTLMRTWMSSFKSDRFVTYEPINYEAVKSVSDGVVPTFDLSKSDCLISFGADFLETWISPVEYARQFTSMRQVKNGERGKFIYIGSRVSMTAVNADHRLIVPPGSEEAFAIAMTASDADPIYELGKQFNIDPGEIKAIMQEILAAKSVLALPGISATSSRAAAIVNKSTGTSLVNTGRPHALTNTSSMSDMAKLIADMESGKIDVLVIHGTNPVYALPESARFVDAMKRVPTVISLSSYMDETTALANWVLPSNTPLESWGDYSPYPDVHNLMQPTMGRLFDTRDTGDILIQLAKSAGLDPVSAFGAANFYDYLRLKWKSMPSDWESLMQGGGEYGSMGVWGIPAPNARYLTPNTPNSTLRTPHSALEVRLSAFSHIYYYDGRGANRRWLQETPEPVIKAVWDTWGEIHPSTAKRLGIKTDDLIEISYKKAKIEVPAYVWEGVAQNTIAVPMGQGHTVYGRFASGTGANVLPLLEVDNPSVEVRKTGKRRWAARIKGSTDQQGREIVQTTSLNEPFKRKKPIILPLPEGYKAQDFYPGNKYAKHRWAMVVDLDRCIGCHACVTACYAENNVGIVGAEGARRRREMSWIRIDRYIDWKDSSAPVLFQPMLCQHCDAAPCEPVCPVFASAHSQEGLNVQIYNRCVGTRYCSHNCPYKVRRFNWFDYQWPEPLNYQLNPDVTVRCRGVMEKCTFCIQRIREAEINALRENRSVRDGEVTPACVQTCPTGVFTFGDLKDPNSAVSKIINEDPRAYQVLAELNTKPAVIYLKRIVG